VRFPSLTTRFALTLLLSTAVPLVLFHWFAVSEMRDVIQRRSVDYMPRLAEAAAEKIATRLDQIRKSLALLVAPARAARRDYEDQVKLLPGVNEDFDAVMLVDDRGRIAHAHFNPGLDPHARAERVALAGEDWSASPWFRAIRGGEGEHWQDRHVSPLLRRSAARASRDPTDYVLGLALEVVRDDGASACVYGLIRWSRIQQVLDETRESAGFPSAECFCTDGSGVYLAHTDRNLYGAAVPEALARPTEGPGGSPLQVVDAAGESRRGGKAPVLRSPAPFRWWFGVHALDSELFQTSRDFARLLSAAIAVIAAILVGWSVAAARAVVRPVRALASATEAVARGDLATRVDDRRRDELGDLGRAFNRMAADLERSRDQLRQAERQAAWAEMARQVAHEIKNPLTPMRMSAQMMLRAKQGDDSRWPELADRLARTVVEQTGALAQIATQFRQFAGPAQPELARLATGDVLADVREFFAPVAAAGGWDLTTESHAGDAVVLGDRRELGRVFINLVQNALDAGASRIDVGSRRDDAAVTFTVSDDGAGIAPAAAERLFEPYFTTKSSGTGLGLAICRRIVEAHGGTIALERSGPGRTVFRVTLPLAP
jgi:signal transduction histidine kinase